MCASPVGKGSNRLALPPGLPVGLVVRWNGFWRAHGIRGIRRVAYMGAVCSGAHPVRHAARVLIVDEHAQGRHFPVRGVIDTARIYLNRSR